MLPLIGILGGSFDPIHYGHLSIITAAQAQLPLTEVKVIPVNKTAHRPLPIAPTASRVNMLELALADISHCSLDLRELSSDATTYTINTVKALRNEYYSASLCFMMGRDAFNQLDSWKDWQALFDYTHIIVVNRPAIDHIISKPLNDWVKQHQTTILETLTSDTHGSIYFIDSPTPDISSTMIRARIKQQQTITDLLPTKVAEYIEHQQLYR